MEKEAIVMEDNPYEVQPRRIEELTRRAREGKVVIRRDEISTKLAREFIKD